MTRDIEPVLDDILETIALVEDVIAGKTRQDFAEDRILGLAIQRAIEIISEASRHIPEEMLQFAPDIPWRSIRGIGNVLRHEYHHIADDVVWGVLIYDLPPLKAAIRTMKSRSRGE